MCNFFRQKNYLFTFCLNYKYTFLIYNTRVKSAQLKKTMVHFESAPQESIKSLCVVFKNTGRNKKKSTFIVADTQTSLHNLS